MRIFTELFLSSVIGVTAVCADAPPPRVEFVPVSNAWTIAKHPSLPVLYVGLDGGPERQSLVTFQLDSAGAIRTDTRQCLGAALASDVPDIHSRVTSLAVNAPQGVLYLSVLPLNHQFVETNINEYAALALDSQGQPTRRLMAWRSYWTGNLPTLAMRHEPSLYALFINRSLLDWYDLEPGGLPRASSEHRVPHLPSCFSWQYVPEWKRFYAASHYPGLYVFQLAGDGMNLTLIHRILSSHPVESNLGIVSLAVNPKLQKAYHGSGLGKELAVYSLTREGRVTGLPRGFPLEADTVQIRFDFRANRVITFRQDSTMQIRALDSDGYPTGEVRSHPLRCGEIRDVLLDEEKGIVYVACTAPPGLTGR